MQLRHERTKMHCLVCCLQECK